MSMRHVGWFSLGLLLATLNLFAARVTWELLTVPAGGPGAGPDTAFRTSEHYEDGRSFEVVSNRRTGEVHRTQLRTWTLEGLARVWWPILSALVFSDLTVKFFRRDAARRLWEVAGDALKTIPGAMIGVAVVAVELGLLLAWMGSVRINLAAASWSGILLCVLFGNLLALIPIGVVVSYLPRSEPEEPLVSYPARPSLEKWKV